MIAAPTTDSLPFTGRASITTLAATRLTTNAPFATQVEWNATRAERSWTMATLASWSVVAHSQERFRGCCE